MGGARGAESSIIYGVRCKGAAWKKGDVEMNMTRRAFTILLAAASLAIGLGGCATASCGSASRTEMIREKLMSSDRNYVFVAMHRGDWRNYPENSRDAILSCIALGADIVELDVQMTKDGRFVLLHDDGLDRTTTGKGKVSEHTLAEIKKLRLKSNQGGKDAKATDYEVLTLEEALALAKDRILVNIDKFTQHPYEILQAVDKAGAMRGVLVKSTLRPADAKKMLREYWARVESGESTCISLPKPITHERNVGLSNTRTVTVNPSPSSMSMLSLPKRSMMTPASVFAQRSLTSFSSPPNMPKIFLE